MIMLETERLVIRPYKESDLPEYHAILSDAENMYFLHDLITHSLEESRLSLQDALRVNAAEKARRFAITLKGSTTHIGAVGYEITASSECGHSLYPAGKTADPMGWFISRAHQNKGYITEAVRRVLAFAFLEDNCAQVITGCFADNLPTQRVMEKVGFIKDAADPPPKMLYGKPRARMRFILTRADYKNLTGE
ncbi:MAG: GNAT family N-acetyltransferase [Defluviitaleaceae bacterium]|nr:GNAT family N-acetyltransferase [Defluviitaleaceae bacterium]MCL2274557.1 GNAT family N-acetyltransferase [Defluviitaleaceae bacterium]